MNVFEQLSIRTTDYFASIGVEDGKFLSKFANSVKGMSCVAKFNKHKFNKLKDLKFVNNIRSLDSSVFNKVLARYSEKLDIRQLVDITDNEGLVLIQNVPTNKLSVLKSLLASKGGIFETWELNSTYDVCDLLFKVRKYK